VGLFRYRYTRYKRHYWYPVLYAIIAARPRGFVNTSSDLMLILDPGVESLSVLRDVAGILGIEHIEVDSTEDLKDVLELRSPTIAVLAIDRVDARGLAALDVLAQHESRPALLLIGSISARVLASARRAAKARGLVVLGLASSPLDSAFIERLLTPHLKVAPPISCDELSRALEEHQLTLLYLPKLAIGSGVAIIQGVEALVRWQHPRRGLLQPRHFLRAAEDYGLLSHVTDFVMAEAIRQAAQWRDNGLSLEIVINLSTDLVRDRAFPERLAQLLEENEFPPEKLTLDVTESASVADRDLLIDVFSRLRILRVGLSLDNFGTGLSSLTEIYRLPFSEIKIDHALIADVPREREARVVVQAIANLAHALQLTVCAEGVESRQMLEFVQLAGFDTAQGHFFSEAVPSVEVEQLVHTWPSEGPAEPGSWRPHKNLDFDGSTTTNRVLRARHATGSAFT
jgi:EAL domain-containing protein (putative c-di-GMP-specific phosphodiesterase class I)